MKTFLSTLIQTIGTHLYSLAFPDPHPFKHNFEFIGYAPSDIKVSIPPRFDDEYNTYQSKVLPFLKKGLYGYEIERIVNEYHHPVATIDEIYNTLDKGDLPEHTIPHDIHYQRAFKRTSDEFRPPQLQRPVHFSDTRFYPYNWHPNVEEPFYSDVKAQKYVNDMFDAGLLDDRRMSFGNLKDYVFVRTRRFLHHLKRGEITNPKTLFPITKIHIKPALTAPPEVKVRVIYGVSKYHVLTQIMFFWPLFRHYIDSPSDPLLWGFETFVGGMSKLNNLMLEQRLYQQTYVTVDWSGFDLRTSVSIQKEMYNEWRTYFDFSNGYLPTRFYHESKADPIQLERLWNWQRDATFEMPFVLPNHAMYKIRHRGWASGLFVTQFGDSWMNLLMIYTILDRMSFDISKLKILVQGDDSLILLIFHLPANQHDRFKTMFSNYAQYYFDAVAHDDKTKIYNSTQGVEVLGFTNNNGMPERDQVKLLAQIYHPRNVPPKAWKSNLMAKCCGFAYASMASDSRTYGILKSIYDHYYAKGFRATQLRDQRDVIMFSEHSFKIDTSHFPTKAEITKYLRVPYKRTIEDKEAYFPGYLPGSHFTAFF